MLSWQHDRVTHLLWVTLVYKIDYYPSNILGSVQRRRYILDFTYLTYK